jgi:hypothetical protein
MVQKMLKSMKIEQVMPFENEEGDLQKLNIIV